MTMTAGNNSEISEQYDVKKHIEYVLGVLNSHETWGIQAALEAISYHIPDQFDYSPGYFEHKLCQFLEKNDVIERAHHEDLYALSERILSTTGRNYRLIDLISAFETMLRAWEIQTGSLEWT